MKNRELGRTTRLTRANRSALKNRSRIQGEKKKVSISGKSAFLGDELRRNRTRSESSVDSDAEEPMNVRHLVCGYLSAGIVGRERFVVLAEMSVFVRICLWRLGWGEGLAV